jgi:hypothetical protein
MRHAVEDEDIELDSDVDDELEGAEPSDEDLLDDADADEEVDTYVEAATAAAEHTAAVAAENEDDDIAAEVEDADVDDDDADEDDEVEDADDDEPSAVDDVDEEVENPRRSPTVSEKKKKSMSDHVRDEIAKRQASGDSLRGVDIVTALAKRGVKVSPAQVSQLLKKAGAGTKSRKPKAAATPAATPEPTDRSRMAVSTRKTETGKKPAGRTPAPAAGLPVARLKAAKAFLAACGSYQLAAETLDLHEQLQDVMRDNA